MSDLTKHQRLQIKARDTARQVFWSEFDRDTHPCRACGRADVRLDVHHRDGDPLNNLLYNLVAVCYRCHRAEHKRRATVARIVEWKAQIDDLGADAGARFYQPTSGLSGGVATDD